MFEIRGHYMGAAWEKGCRGLYRSVEDERWFGIFFCLLVLLLIFDALASRGGACVEEDLGKENEKNETIGFKKEDLIICFSR